MSSPVYDTVELQSLVLKQEERINKLEKDVLDTRKVIKYLIDTLKEIL